MKFIERLEIPGLNSKAFFISCLKPISIGIAISGGGYRSFLNGAGTLAAFDNRSLNSTLPGHLGGILQSSSYISGISGGSWIVMSMLLGNNEPVMMLKREWEITEPLLEGVLNIGQVEVSRADVQVLSDEFRDNDDEFYTKLNNIDNSNNQKRSLFKYSESLSYLASANSSRNFSGDIFDNFYNRMENFSHFSDDQFQFEYQDDLSLQRFIQSSKTKRTLSNNAETASQEKLAKRELITKPQNIDEWFENFKTFFKDIFKKKEPGSQGQGLLNMIDISSKDVSLKIFQKVFYFYKNLHLEVRAKKMAGFPVSFTDYWGRALSRRIFPKDSRSLDKTLSSTTASSSFKLYEQPFPIFVSNLRHPGDTRDSVTSTIFEFTPYEFGSWDLGLFAKLKYLGSLLHNGKPIFHISKNFICFRNFDNVGFITGTSSSLFNSVLIYIWQIAASSKKDQFRAIKAVLNLFGLTSQQENIDPKKHPDYALYSPNPFYKFGSKVTSDVYHSKQLYMVDGGEDGQNIPLQPLLQPSRHLDLIFAIDSTADIKGWPNGTILRNTKLRYNNTLHKGTTISISGNTRVIDVFPEIPDPEIFISEGLNSKPTFFGCHLEDYPTRRVLNSSETFTNVNEYLPPIIGYYGNTMYSYPSNTSTFQLKYSSTEVSKLIENGYNIMTYSNSTIEENYSKCVGCIAMKREFDRQKMGLSLINDFSTPEFCLTCYNTYCFN